MAESGRLRVEPLGEREILIVRSFDAPRRLVFEAMTQPTLLRRWLLGPDGWSLDVCEIDLRPGGKYRYLWRKDNRAEMGMGGVYQEIAPPERIVGTERFDEDWTGGETVSTLLLKEEGGGTTLTNTILYSSKEARDAVLQSPMAEGLGTSYDRLDGVLASSPR